MTGRSYRSEETLLGPLSVSIEGTGPVALLWHSLFVDDRSWDAAAVELSPHRTLIRITGPCHGSSTARTTPFTLIDCASAALQILDRVRGADPADPADWVGDAWGGHVGIVLAARHPERVRSLVAFDSPVAALTPAQARPLRLASTILASVGAVAPLRRRVRDALLTPVHRRTATAAYIDACLRRSDGAALANAVRCVGVRRPDLTSTLRAVRAPVALVVGAADPLWTASDAAAAATLPPDGSSFTVEGSSHLTPLEQPEASARIVLDHWARAG